MTRILIADDNTQNLYLLETILKGCGYEVTSAKDGAEALAFALKNTPDLIVADILMPEMDGFELCRRCKANEQLHHIPFIFYTATYTDSKDEQFALSLGADRFVIKPQQPELLVQIIQEVLTKSLEVSQVSRKISPKDEKEVIQRYNRVLFHKLGQKVLQLEDAIAKQKMIENELRESEERYRSIFENSADAILLTAPDGRIFKANPAACGMFGHTEAELVQLGRRGVVDATDPRLSAALEERKRTGRFSGELIFLRREGQPFPGELDSVVFQEKDGQTRTIMIIRDITERKRMEEERLRLLKLESVGTLAGGIAHDFNNILTAILGNISLASMKIREGDAKGLLKEAEKASLRAKDLTQQLLTLTTKGTPIKKLTSIRDLIKEISHFVLSGSSIKCHFSIPDDLWSAEVDEGQIGQVISNLVINARQAMPTGGNIEISAENMNLATEQHLGKILGLPQGDYIRITVKDQGIGIPPEHLERIFDPFFTTKQTGSGLGLATCYSIVRNHGGHIRVESEVRMGSTFYVYLPASKEKVVTASKADETEQVKAGKILVMDDEETVREVAGRMLKHVGCEDIQFAAEGKQAIKLYQKAMKSGKPFDIVILDLTVPGGMGGIETIDKLREIDQQVRAVVSSGYADNTAMAEYKKYGFKGVVAKPYTLEQLKKTLHGIIAETTDMD